MCGIAGIITAETGRLDLRSIAEQMQGTLTHRGPDDRGLFVSADGLCALAHTRLSILDLSSAGHQPMGLGWGKVRNSKSEIRNEQYWITYNGEIYNYLQLREELGAWSKEHGAGKGQSISNFELRIANLENSQEQSQRSDDRDQRSEANNQRSDIRGQRSEPNSEIRNSKFEIWNSNSDTEVILRAYERWGRECVNHLRGMFAFAIWDEQKQELFLARDPLGIKPLYFYRTEHTFLFASEVRALLASGLVPRKLSLDGLASYLEFGSVQDPLTIVNGLDSLLPGHFLRVQLDDRRLKTELFQYSSNLFNQTGDGVPASRPEAVKLLRSKLEDSVRVHLVSDVPVGAFLSGGIDSSAIVALMSRVADQKPKTFSVVFKESEFSEAAHAQRVARTFGTEHREIMLSEGQLLGMLPDALAAMDQPTMDGINTYVVSKAVKESGITVALSGLGGDELFGGYPSFRRAKQLQKMDMLPRTFRYAAGAAGRAILNGSARNQKLWDLVESNCTPAAAYNISRRLFAPNEISALLADLQPPTSDLRPRAPSSTLPAINQRSEIRHQKSEKQSEIRNSQSEIDSDVVNAVSRYELGGYMANTLLRDTDQMSMAHALEVRVPFIDPVVVSLVLGLPGEWKTDSSRPKPLLLDAVGDLLPEEVWRRPKMGFTLPFQRWLRSSLTDEIDTTLSGGKDLTRIGIEPDHARSVWHAFKKNPQHEPWSRPWALYVLSKWCDLNDVTA